MKVYIHIYLQHSLNLFQQFFPIPQSLLTALLMLALPMLIPTTYMIVFHFSFRRGGALGFPPPPKKTQFPSRNVEKINAK